MSRQPKAVDNNAERKERSKIVLKEVEENSAENESEVVKVFLATSRMTNNGKEKEKIKDCSIA